jgi:hypothetical protein
MKRHKDWVKRLDATISKSKGRDFDWKSHNCVSFISECLVAVTGQDPMTGWHDKAGQIKTKKQAFALLKKYGKGKIMEAAETGAKKNRLSEIKPTFAKRGDPVVAANENGEEVFGIIGLSGREVVGLHPEKGLTYLPMKQIVKAWSIP